jgi:hypothetical protein
MMRRLCDDVRVIVLCLILPTGLSISCGQSAAEPLGKPTVSADGRCLIYDDGQPFFYLGDTAWELFHRLDRNQARMVADLPLIDKDPAKPAVTPGNNPDDAEEYDYWDQWKRRLHSFTGQPHFDAPSADADTFAGARHRRCAAAAAECSEVMDGAFRGTEAYRGARGRRPRHRARFGIAGVCRCCAGNRYVSLTGWTGCGGEYRRSEGRSARK